MTKRKYLFYLLPLLCILLNTGCSKDEPDITGDIWGVVRDADGGKEIEGALVTLSPTGETDHTNSKGMYSFNDVKAGNYEILVQCVNYVSGKQSISVEVGKATEVNFSLQHAKALLEVQPTELTFTGDDDKGSIEIHNKGNAEMTWEVHSEIEWLKYSPATGNIKAGKNATLNLTVDRSGLGGGHHSQTFTISTNGGGNSTIRVNLSIPVADISATPENLNFDNSSSVADLELKNIGDAALSYTLEPSNTWIRVSKNKGTLNPNTTENVIVTVDRTGMSGGDYEGHIMLTADGRSRKIPVWMKIPSSEDPKLHIYDVTDITHDKAVFKASITSTGASPITQHGFCWSTSENPKLENAQYSSQGDRPNAADFSHEAKSLKSATQYYVRAYAKNENDVFYSPQESFVTEGIPSAPTVKTLEVTNIEPYQADAIGEITEMGNVTPILEYGHVWSTRNNPTLNDEKTEKGEKWGTGQFTSVLKNLKPRVTYYVRAYAINAEGTSYGEVVSFITNYANVELETAEVTDITSKTATVGGKIINDGGHTIIERGVCWGGNTEPTIDNNRIQANTTADEFVLSLTGLTAETQYYVRAYVKTGTEEIFYGKEKAFRTQKKETDITVEDFDDEQFWNK